MAAELFELRRAICSRSTGANDWGCIPSREPHVVFEGTLILFWEAVSRNIHRARRRRLLSQTSRIAGEMEPITLQGGTTP